MPDLIEMTIEYLENPDHYWEARGGAGYLESLQDPVPEVVSFEREWFSRILQKVTPFSLLDFGCGTGRLFDFWRTAGDVFACDRSRSMIRVACQSGYPYKVVCLNSNDKVSLPYSDRQFDLIVAADVLAHIRKSDIVNLIHEFQRISRGTFVFKVPKEGSVHLFYSYEYDYKELLKGCFTIQSDETFGPNRYIEAFFVRNKRDGKDDS